MVSPEGYWKSLRLMQQAEKFHRPVICLVDTPGAFCGLEAEERGQGEAIAKNLYTLAGLTVPVLSVVIGEGGSGGALALRWQMKYGCWSIPFIPSCPRRALPPFSGKTAKRQRKQQQ